ncbi:MAG: MlaD family protein [Pirellulales bacterium]|nr:MlaD family protein [Pirellulales bacterium]
MEDRSKQFKVGVVLVATILATGLLVVLTSDFSWSPFRDQYQLQVLVDQAPGVAPDTPVRRRGILIGRVAEVLDTDDGALITVDIDQGKQIKTNEVVRIQTSLIGDAVVEFAPGPPSPNAQVVAPGGPPFAGMYNPSPLDLIANLQGDLKQTIQSLGRAGEEVGLLAERLNQVLGGQDIDRIDRLFLSAENAMNNIASVMANVDDVLGNDQFKAELKKGLAQLPAVIEEVNMIMKALERAISSADQNLVNLQGLTEPLGERGPEIVDAMESGVGNLSELLGEGALLAKNINKSDGTLGKLINDDELYRRLAGTIGQASAAVSDVQALINDPMIHRRIQQVLYNTWVFTDKIARDPARVVRGLTNRETPIK